MSLHVEPIRAVVADDEPLARRMLVRLLAHEPDVSVVAQTGNGPATIEAVRTHTPDLLFLDVRMPGASGMDVLAALGPDAVRAVVLVTAYDDYAVTAFEHDALDYVLKPVDETRFRRTVERARRRIHVHRSARLAETMLQPRGANTDERYLSRIVARSTGKLTVVEVANIDWVKAADDYLEVHAVDGVHIVRGSMASLEARLDPAKFVRIHRSTIIRLSRVKELQPYFHGDYAVTLHDGTRLRLSRTYRAGFQAALGQEL